ncbi:MAG TPA: substrate-binding domain-containing protein [Actinoplanes sp.]|nr:substrate-binding domain-containing protein [Actinoplanes sp.]
MAKHRAGPATQRMLLLAAAILGVVGLVLAGVFTVLLRPFDDLGTASGGACERPVRVVAASSFAPVLAAMAAGLDQDDDCLRLEVTTADGRAAAKRAAEVNADVWIPDDSSWASTAGSLGLAQAPAAGAGTVVATSPLYMVADKATGARLVRAGRSWLGLAGLVEAKSAKLVVRDPAGSGDGLVGAGAVAEAVWLAEDMDASALWLADAKQNTRTVTGAERAMPANPGEVGVVAEYALLREGKAARDLTVLPGTDRTAMLRYTWFPLAAAASDPARATALELLRSRLTGPGAAPFIRAAGLRMPNPGQGAGSDADDPLPTPTAEPFEVLKPHHVDHVFATWYAADRRTDLLVVVDISGSMAAPASGTKASRIELVRQGCRSVGTLLPETSRMGLWEFGTKLNGNRDYRQLLAMTALNAEHRRALTGAVNKLDARATGTGLYDTILAAYTSARDGYQKGVPNQVLILTDGRNEADEGSLTAGQLTAALQSATDKDRPVQLSVVTFGKASDAKVINDAIEPVGGYVDNLLTAAEVAAAFIHVAAGGLHH